MRRMVEVSIWASFMRVRWVPLMAVEKELKKKSRAKVGERNRSRRKKKMGMGMGTGGRRTGCEGCGGGWNMVS